MVDTLVRPKRSPEEEVAGSGEDPIVREGDEQTYPAEKNRERSGSLS